MKKVIIALACVAMAVSSYAQGFVGFSTQTAGVKIYDTDGVTPLSGSGYLAQLYAYEGKTTDASLLTAAGTAFNFMTGTTAGYILTTSGTTTSLGVTLTSSSRSVQVASDGVPVTLQVRAWAGGTTKSYEDAVAAKAATGFSALWTQTATAAGGTPKNISGLTSFKLTSTVPEPTTIALGVMGLGALLFRRRK
jgi:hypothetical protein